MSSKSRCLQAESVGDEESQINQQLKERRERESAQKSVYLYK